MRALVMLCACIIAGALLSGVAVACDGIQETCPAKEETLQKTYYILDQGSAAMKGSKTQSYQSYRNARVFASAQAAADDFVAWVNSGPTGICQTSPQTRSSFTGWTVEQTPSLSLKYTQHCGGVLTGTWGIAIYTGGSVTNWICDNPMYPSGPDVNNLCHKSSVCKAGVTEMLKTTAQMQAQNSLCVQQFGTSKNCKMLKSNSVNLAVQLGGQESFYHNWVATGEECNINSPTDNPYLEKPEEQKCALLPDGRKVCMSGTPNNEAQPGPCIATDKGVDCLKTEPPESVCAKTPTLPQCLNPTPTKCGFDDKTLLCTDAPTNCGTIAGKSVCICSNGGTRAWTGGANTCGGGGTDPVLPPGNGGGGSGGGTGSGDGVGFGGRCASGGGDILNLDCLFENASESGTHDVDNNGSINGVMDGFVDGIADGTGNDGAGDGGGGEGGGGGPLGGMISGFGGGACPTIPVGNFYGTQIDITLPCDWIAIGRSILEWLVNFAMVILVYRRFREAL